MPRGACLDRNPWDNTLSCTKPAGHDRAADRREQMHEVDKGWSPIRWNNDCHWPGDECGRGAHTDMERAA